MTLTELTAALGRLRDVPADERRDGVAGLLPELRRWVWRQGVDEDAKLRLVGRALRLVSPRSLLPDDARQALVELEQRLESPRGPGRPPIGPAREISMREETWAMVQVAAHQEGLVSASGKPRWGDILGLLVTEALRARGLHPE